MWTRLRKAAGEDGKVHILLYCCWFSIRQFKCIVKRFEQKILKMRKLLLLLDKRVLSGVKYYPEPRCTQHCDFKSQ